MSKIIGIFAEGLELKRLGGRLLRFLTFRLGVASRECYRMLSKTRLR